MTRQLNDSWRMFLGTFEALRRLGYSADDIYANYAEDEFGEGSLFILVRGYAPTGGDFQFRVGTQKEATLDEDYNAALRLWNDPAQKQLRLEVYQEWLHRVGGMTLLQCLFKAGITPPKWAEAEA